MKKRLVHPAYWIAIALAAVVFSLLPKDALAQTCLSKIPQFVSNQNGVLVINYPGCRCPDGEMAGCYNSQQQAIYYLDNEDRKHELEHVDGKDGSLGMRHTEWKRGGGMTCAQVTNAGNTKWKVGEWICRAPSGIYMSGGT